MVLGKRGMAHMPCLSFSPSPKAQAGRQAGKREKKERRNRLVPEWANKKEWGRNEGNGEWNWEVGKVRDRFLFVLRARE